MGYLMLIFGYKFAKCKKSINRLNLNYLCCAIVFLSYHLHNVDAAYRPHIIFIMADDLGWNDVSFHGSDQILTPNLDALAYNGIILNNLYTQPVCTPSRAALLTGKYPIHLGMQGAPILGAEPVGLPLTEKTLADYLKELGYSTKAVGKWHLGYYKKEYTPRFRGFDNFYGYYTGLISYYDHILQDVYENIGEFTGYDLHRDEQPAWQDTQSTYATDLFTKEAVKFINDHDPEDAPLFLYVAHLAVHAANAGKLLEAPQEEIDKFRHIIDPNRRTYAAMVSKLDESVGEIIEALENKEMLKDSIIVFMSDNGAPSAINGSQPARSYPNWGSNFPFRGAKGTLWEGGVRSPGILWSASLQQSPRVSTNLMHVSDWLPTLYSAAGLCKQQDGQNIKDQDENASIPNENDEFLIEILPKQKIPLGGNIADLSPTIDGVDQWLTLTLNLPSRPRTSVLLNIDERSRNAGIRVENWKLIIGTAQNGNYDGYYGDAWDIFEGYRNTYNASAVLDSKTGQAMEALAKSLFVSWTNEVDIKTRRQQATITCESGNFWGNAVQMSCQTSPCLFNIEADPCERNNVARLYPAITSQLYDILKYYRLSLVPQINQPVDVRANPKLWNNTWSTWLN